jgi:hypothetical protein
MKIAIALLSSLVLGMPALACDKVDAAKVQLALAEMGASWSEQDGRVVLHWGREWDGAAAPQRARLLQAFAQGDACLAGGPREIAFYRKGELVGRAAPAQGVQLLDAATLRVARGGAAATDCTK